MVHKMSIANKLLDNEVCLCGHTRLEHSGKMLAVGHGACNICGCRQFTWSKFKKSPYKITKNPKEAYAKLVL